LSQAWKSPEFRNQFEKDPAMKGRMKKDVRKNNEEMEEIRKSNQALQEEEDSRANNIDDDEDLYLRICDTIVVCSWSSCYCMEKW